MSVVTNEINNVNTTNKALLFPLGDCYMTPGIVDLVERFYFPINNFLALLQVGDPGVLEAEDVESNVDALRSGRRIFSAYAFESQPNESIKIWIITEADRSSTIVLLPEEY